MIDESSEHKLYRYIPFDYVKSEWETGVTLFKRPELWSDRTENPLLASRGCIIGGRLVDLSATLAKLAFAQCWTTEAKLQEWCWWRPFGNEGAVRDDVVRISVMKDDYIRDILKSFDGLYAQGAKNITVFTNEVSYHETLQDYVEHLTPLIREFLQDTSGSTIARTLFHKLSYHAHENEYRIVVLDHLASAFKSDFFGIKVRPKITSIDVGPSCSDSMMAQIQEFGNQNSIQVNNHVSSSLRDHQWVLDS